MAGLNGVRSRMVAAGAWVSGPSTLMSVLGLSQNEVINCRAARWALDPLARHGIGAAMLVELAKEIGVTIDDPGACTVRVEVEQPNSRADIVISGGGSVIVIEAKVNAVEGHRQAERLEGDWPEADCLVFLTRERRSTLGELLVPKTAADPDRWRWLTWRWIAETVERFLAVSPPYEQEKTLEARQALSAWARSVGRSIS